MNLYAGLDVGGTAVKFGVADSTGRVVSQDQVPTEQGREPLLELLALVISKLSASHTRAGVGVGTAGAVDFSTGTVVGHSPNLQGWADTPVAARLREKVRIPVVVDNDANCMALAESRLGAGAGCSSVLFLTLGTGVGSAFVQGGQLWRGAHGMSGEFGHSSVVKDGRLCACGQRGHLEAYASATALVTRTVELARQGLPSLYAGVSDEAARVLGAREIFAAAAGGDVAAAQATSEAASYLACGIASAVNLLDPERVVLGGGMITGDDPFLLTVASEVKRRVHEGVANFVEVVPARLGNQAGWVGAALLAGDSA